MKAISLEGLNLCYEIAEGPLTPIFFVHGWGCDHTYFTPQFEYFGGRGHTVVSVDLRGHGESSKPRQEYSIDIFAEDIASIAAELNLQRPVLVGHSMGGVITFEVAARHPELPSAIVMIDSPVTRPAASRAAMPAFLQELEGPNYRAALSKYVSEALFLPTDDEERKAHILARMTKTEQHVLVSAFRGMQKFNLERTSDRIICPSLYIAADDRPLTDLPQLFDHAPNLLFGQTVGSGHFCQLEVPEQINAMISRFISIQV